MKILEKCESVKATNAKWFVHINIDDGSKKSISADDLIASELGLPYHEYASQLLKLGAVKCPRETADLMKGQYYFSSKKQCDIMCAFVVEKFKKFAR